MICGVDISSASLEACIGREGAAGSFPNHGEGIGALAAFCHAHQVERVAMEATGGYEQQPFAGLSSASLPVAILNPRAVRQFAQSMGRLEKTDTMDAGMIAWYAEGKTPRRCAWLRPAASARAGHPPAPAHRNPTAQLNQQRLILDRSVQATFR
jgi:transposase